jgi:hypothetical protein
MKKNRNWIIVFVVLAVLGVLAVGMNLAYNSTEPLTLEKLNAARDLWAQKRPPNYDLKIIFSKTYSSSDGTTGTVLDKFAVEVRAGKVTGFTINGKEPEPLLDEKGQRKLAEEQAQKESYDIAGLFDSIEELMERDRRDHRTTYILGRFANKTDGHLVRFTRQFQGRREQHIQVELTTAKE